LENTINTPISASKARATLFRLIDQTSKSHQPIHISGKRASAVLVSADDWQAIQETLYLLSVPCMRESIKKGMAEPLEASSQPRPLNANRPDAEDATASEAWLNAWRGCATAGAIVAPPANTLRSRLTDLLAKHLR